MLWIFLIKVVIRIGFIYLLLMVPMLAPDRGLLPALIIAIIVVGIQRLMFYYSYRSSKFEFVTLRDISVLVKVGKMLMDVMKKNRVTPERLLAEFRSMGITNLGKVRRAYFESTGKFTKYVYENPRTSLCILPLWDEVLWMSNGRLQVYMLAAIVAIP